MQVAIHYRQTVKLVNATKVFANLKDRKTEKQLKIITFSFSVNFSTEQSGKCLLIIRRENSDKKRSFDS